MGSQNSFLQSVWGKEIQMLFAYVCNTLLSPEVLSPHQLDKKNNLPQETHQNSNWKLKIVLHSLLLPTHLPLLQSPSHSIKAYFPGWWL